MSDTNLQKKKLLLSDCIRVIITYIILLLNIPDFVKIFLIMISDTLDCGVPVLLLDDWIDCKDTSVFYQQMDKITDTITYIMLLIYIINKNVFSSSMNKVLIGLFAFRLVGTSLFLAKNNHSYLFYFPNFFLEVCLALSIIFYLPTLKKYLIPILFGVFIYKLIQEYYLHVYKPSHNRKENFTE